MLKRRAKIKVKPVISAATNNSIQSDAVDETTEVNVAVNEIPVENVTQQQTQENILNGQQQTEDNDDETVKVEVRDENQNFFDDSIFDKLDQASLRLNSTIDHDSHNPSHACAEFGANEGIPTFTEYVNIPVTFEEDCDLDSRSESPISISTFVREEEIVETIQPTYNSSILDDQDKKQAAERLADRLVKRRIGERHRVRASGVLDEPVNSSRLCMRDLIYLNPKDNPMINTQVNEGSMVLKEATERKIESKPTNFDVSVPQLEIGPDGNIKINKDSLVIHQSVDDLSDLMVVDDTNYFFDGYKSKKPRAKKWGLKETKRFYAALSMIGTDFSLISKLFPNRTRDEIKNKFKSEDRRNRALIDTALKVKKPLDISLLAEPPSDDDLKDEKPAPPKKKKKKADATKEATAKKDTKTPTKKRKLYQEGSTGNKLGKAKRKVGAFVSSDEGSETEDEMTKVDQTKRRKVIEDDDDDSSTNHSAVDPYRFTDEVEDEVAGIMRPTRIQQEAVPEEEEETQTMPVQFVADESFQEKFSQQLQQMEADQKRSEMRIIAEDVIAEDVIFDQPDEEDSPDDCFKLFNELPMKNKSNLNIVDHKDLNLEQLGVAEVPPNTKVVVVSTPFKEGGDESQQQLLQIFLIAEDSVGSVIEEIKNSEDDAITILLKMAQHHTISMGGEVQGYPLIMDSDPANDAVDVAESYPSLMSPPVVQDELFDEDESANKPKCGVPYIEAIDETNNDETIAKTGDGGLNDETDLPVGNP